METFASTGDQNSQIPIIISKNLNYFQEELKDPPDKPKPTKNSRSKPLTRTLFVQKKVETYSLDELGKIENAKKHRDANRPLHVLQEINNNVNFCHCCDLPCPEKGIIEPFKVSDHADTFAECGIGISLYFFFFKFVIFISFLGILSLSIVLMVLNMEYSSGIKDVCNSKFKNTNATKIGNCYGYVTEIDNNENYYKMFNQWLQRFSSDSIFIYRRLPRLLRGSINNNVDDVLVNYSLINFLFLITTFILNIIFLLLIRAQIKRLRARNITIRDYTVLIINAKKILKDYIDQKNKARFNCKESQIEVENFNDFKQHVNLYIKGDKNLHDITIEHINICYRLGDYLTLMEKFEKKKLQIFKINNRPYITKRNAEKNLVDNNRRYYKYPLGYFGIHCCCAIEGKTLGELIADKERLNNQLNEEELRIRGIIKEQDFTDYMLISFNKIEDKEKFLSFYPKDFFGKIGFFFTNIKYYICPCFVDKEERKNFWRSKDIHAVDPPEPEDIFWQNFAYTTFQRFQYTLSTYVICLLTIAVSFGIVFGLSYLQEHLYSDDKENGDTNIFLKYLTSLSITIVTSIINSLIQLVLEKLTFREKPISKSNYVLSLSIKISIFTFLNCAIIPLICKHIVANNQKDEVEQSIDYFVKRKRDDLLIDDMFVYFLVNAIITPLLWILNFPYWYKKLRICCIRCKKDDPDKHHHMTQKELNDLFEYPDMNLAYKLSYLVKTLSMCFFYFPIFPGGFIIAFIGFVFAYWVEKYVFTNQCKRPDMLDEIIEKYYANFFIVVLFIGGIGDYIFLHDAFDTNAWCLVNIILFGVLIIVPYTKLINCNYVDAQRSYRDKPLSDVYFTFYNDYQRQNPLTKKLGLETYLNELKNKGYLSENAFNIAIDNIENLNLMEMYYGISKGDMALVQQSILANVPSESIVNVNNLRGTILATGGIKSTVVRPELKDNQEEKQRKKEFFESQIMNLFGKPNANRENRGDLDVIQSINEGGVKNSNIDIIEQIENKLNIGSIPVTKSVYKDGNNNNNNNK